MKKFLLFSLLLLELTSCSKSPQQIIESKIKNFMNENLNDPKSYEAISFSKIDTIWTKFDESDNGKEISSKYFNAQFSLKQALLNINSDDAKRIYPNAVFEDSIKYYQNITDSLKPLYEKGLSDFKPTPESFYIQHSYRAKNKMGALIKDDITFYFDDNLNITGTNK